MNALATQIEALLFTAGEAVPFSELKELTNATDEELQNALTEISQQLEGHGIALVTTPTHAQLTTSPEVGEFLNQFNQEETPELSKAALETLSVVAYRGPITRFELDAIRGVDSRHMLRQLFGRGLVRQLRSSGKAPAYDVTEEFLLHLGVKRKEELPDLISLRDSEKLHKLTENLS